MSDSYLLDAMILAVIRIDDSNSFVLISGFYQQGQRQLPVNVKAFAPGETQV